MALRASDDLRAMRKIALYLDNFSIGATLMPLSLRFLNGPYPASFCLSFRRFYIAVALKKMPM